MIEYEWSAELEAAARAIAFVDGWDPGQDAYSVLKIPSGRAAQYWVRAQAAISAYLHMLTVDDDDPVELQT
jgi:hypothetical protein